MTWLWWVLAGFALGIDAHLAGEGSLDLVGLVQRDPYGSDTPMRRVRERLGHFGPRLGQVASGQLRERMRLMNGLDAANGVRDGLTDFSTPVSGAYDFAPSQESLDAICG